MKNAPRSFRSTGSVDEAVEAMVVFRGAIVDRMPDAVFFLAFAAVWGAVFWVVLSSKL